MKGDKDILMELTLNKENGFEKLFNRYYRPMCVVGSKYISSLDTVEDLVQEILINIWNKDDYKNLKNLKSYLFTSVRNKCLSQIKNNKLAHIEDIDFNWETDLFIHDDSDDYIASQIKKINTALATLPAGSREVFDAVVISGYKYKEAAEELNVSINTIKTQLRRAYRLIEKNLTSFIVFSVAFL